LETALEGSGEEPGLSVETGLAGVVPDEVVGLRDFRREVELRGDDVFGNVGRELAVVSEPGPLGGGRTGDDDYRGKLALGVGFVEQRNVCAEPEIAARRISCLLHPAVTNDGMEDLLKLTPSGRIGKDNFTEARPVGAAITADDVTSKGRSDRFLNAGIACEQLVGAAVGVEKLRWQMAAQGSGKTGFSRRHAPRYA